MTRYELEDSIWKLIPQFFPEIKPGETSSYVFIDARSNPLILSITFYKPKVRAEFGTKLQKLTQFLKDEGILPISKEIIKPFLDYEKEEETYYYQIPLHIAQGFSD